MRDYHFSIIVPVYNRPEEIAELLASVNQQTYRNFEVIVIEDGSDVPSETVVSGFVDHFPIQYNVFEKIGPSLARNKGMELGRGDYFIFIDSDCLIPEDYLQSINENLNCELADVFGGSDRASKDFSPVQKAISYAMTSFFTTGGIRGGKKQVGRFHPRSFNMGISRKAFELTGGFPVTKMHPGEDMVFSIELISRGIRTVCFPDSFVYHKRRTSFLQFFRQVFRFGQTRYIISRVYPETFRIFFLFPTLFILGAPLLILLGFVIHPDIALFLFSFLFVILVDATMRLRSIRIGLLGWWAAIIQFSGYGLGFLFSWWRNSVLKQDEFGVFKNGFYDTDRS